MTDAVEAWLDSNNAFLGAELAELRRRLKALAPEVPGAPPPPASPPPSMFGRELREGRLVRPFDVEVVTGAYWLTRLKSRDRTYAMRAFEGWIADEAARPQ